jgi:hypothetical protein
MVGIVVGCAIRDICGLVGATCISVTGIRANIIATNVIYRTILLSVVTYRIIVLPITIIAYITAITAIIGCIDRRWSTIAIIH